MMTPSRIRSAGGAANYYGKDDYYVTGEAGAPGIAWGGRGAEALGLSGLARTDDFHAVLGGRNPHPEGPGLTGGGPNAKHHPGWDFTFTVPKSVSLAIVAAERIDPELAVRLQAHVLAANRTMMDYLEANHAFTRVRGERGAVRAIQSDTLVYASVLHRTTRGGDPHFHVHNPTANTTRNPETRTWGALETRQIFKWQQVASQVGARDLQARLMAEGFNLERRGELKWEIAGSDPGLLAEFSSRSAEIDQAGAALAASRNLVKLTPAQRDMVQKQTRKDKQVQDRDALADEWHARAAALEGNGLSSLLHREPGPGRDLTATLKGEMHAGVQALRKAFRDLAGLNRQTDAFAATPERPDSDPDARRLMAFGVKVAEAGSAVHSKHLALLHAMRAAPAGVTYARLDAALARLEGDGLVVKADKEMPGGITTRRMIEAEKSIVAAVHDGRGAVTPILPPWAAARAVERSTLGAALNTDQRAAVEGFFLSRDKYRAVPGFAGVGKTFAFSAVREIAEAHGQRIQGLSSLNTHVQEFRNGAGIRAQTIASWLQSVEPAMAAGGAHLTSARKRWKGAHLIIDEASTLTNESGYRIVGAVKALEIGSVTVSGDCGQTGGPGAGNVFKAVLDRDIEQFPLRSILRQRHAATSFREGVRDLAEGRLGAGMARLAPHVHALGRDATDLDIARRAVELWADRRAAGQQTVLITATNQMRGLQSRLARDVLKTEGVLGAAEETRERLSHKHMTRPEQVTAGAYQLGDILVFNKAFAGRGPVRGERATVIGIDQENNLLKLQGAAGLPRYVDLNREHARGYLRFSTYSVGAHEVAEGERLVWEARFRDRGYERGGEFTVTQKGRRTWTVVHADGRIEKVSACDPALAFTSYAYAMTTERAQGKTITAPIATMTSREGQAVAQTKNYVNWSRLTHSAAMVTDDAPRVLRMLAQNDGQKPVALDHVRDAWNAAQASMVGQRRAGPEATADIPSAGRGRVLERDAVGLQQGTERSVNRPRAPSPAIDLPTGKGGLGMS
jgi:conjugative relaxase-like TrwC/TraI family protein